ALRRLAPGGRLRGTTSSASLLESATPPRGRANGDQLAVQASFSLSLSWTPRTVDALPLRVTFFPRATGTENSGVHSVSSSAGLKASSFENMPWTRAPGSESSADIRAMAMPVLRLSSERGSSYPFTSPSVQAGVKRGSGTRRHTATRNVHVSAEESWSQVGSPCLQTCFFATAAFPLTREARLSGPDGH